VHEPCTLDEPQMEWPQGLDVGALKAQGWKPLPFREFILKIHSRCNLACDYCYMYELADQSWQHQPTVMSRETISASAGRIADYVRRHRLSSIRVILHGGEPLMAGKQLIGFVAEEMHAAIGESANLKLSIQTNGTLLTAGILDLLRLHSVRVGVSLDGSKPGHDLHRRYRDGRGSYEVVARGLRLLISAPYRPLFAGLLSVIDLRNDPVETYESLASFAPPKIDFLLPHATWSQQPPGRANDSSTPYADWLIAVFDHWWRQGPGRTEVRLFKSVVRLLLGANSGSEQVGLDPADMLVIETDGSIEQVDTLKAAFAGAPETGFRITDGDLDTVAESPGIVARQLGMAALSDTCVSCRLSQICGGGNYSHRYKPGTGFRNPSVYCVDLMKFIDHVSTYVQADLDSIKRGRHVLF
jgi:uncharacterized protein